MKFSSSRPRARNRRPVRPIARLLALTLAIGASITTLQVEAAGAADGGVNTGQPGSVCAPEVHSTASPPEPGVSTTWLGAGAPAPYEIGPPTGIFAGRAPKGVMIVIHGGGWYHVGAADVAAMRNEANRWRERGWSTVNIDYRACGQSVDDVLWFYDAVRARSGSTPICATGSSAGGHLALLLAARRPDVACVISQGGPTDLTTIATQPAFGDQLVGPSWVYELGVAAFGLDMLPQRSPALEPIKARVLLANATNDPFIPPAQLTELADNQRARDPNAYVDVLALESGPEPFTHANVSRRARETFWQRELRLVAPLVAPSPSVANPIRLVDTRAQDGSMQLEVSSAPSTMTATAGSTDIYLGRGYRYGIQTCVTSLVGSLTKCSPQDIVDAKTAVWTVVRRAPTVAATFTRSTKGDDYVIATVVVTREDANGGWVTIASSWPDIGLGGSGIAVPRAA